MLGNSVHILLMASRTVSWLSEKPVRLMICLRGVVEKACRWAGWSGDGRS